MLKGNIKNSSDIKIEYITKIRNIDNSIDELDYLIVELLKNTNEESNLKEIIEIQKNIPLKNNAVKKLLDITKKVQLLIDKYVNDFKTHYIKQMGFAV